MLDKAIARRKNRKKRLPRLSDELPLFDFDKAAEVVRESTKDLPQYLEHVKPYLQTGRAKFEDAYVAVLQAIITQKEKLEDFLAERKDSARKARLPHIVEREHPE
ncbi:MAG: hypothetical protein ACAI35_06275 [Candidatus Methylacidiphilales bacterium]|nr:hypothetical protein [Candidatus Methylacidiphilales bacterium]